MPAADTFGPSAASHLRGDLAVADAKLGGACERIAEFMEKVGAGVR